MDQCDVDAIYALTPLTVFLQESCLSREVQTVLVNATYTRAILLLEITERVLVDQLALSTDDVIEARTVCNSIRLRRTKELATRGRHIPVVFQRLP